MLLLLRSPAISVGFTVLGEIVAYVAIFISTIEAVTFRLCGWCVLGVFLLLLLLSAFTRECQDLLSSCGGMHVWTD